MNQDNQLNSNNVEGSSLENNNPISTVPSQNNTEPVVNSTVSNVNVEPQVQSNTTVNNVGPQVQGNAAVNNVGPQVQGNAAVNNVSQSINNNINSNVNSNFIQQNTPSGSINNQPKNNKSKIIIAVIIAVVLIIGVIVIANKGDKSSSGGGAINNSGGQKASSNKVVSNNRDISYINPKGGSDNKVAILPTFGDPVYAITFDFDDAKPLSGDFLNEMYEGTAAFEIDGGDYHFKVKAFGLDIEIIKYESFELGVNILRQEGNWYLTQSNDEKDPNIFLKMTYDESGSTEWIHFILSKDGETEGINSQYFDELIKHVNSYRIDQTAYDEEKKMIYLDNDNKEVDLSDYTFLNDYIAKSGEKYNLFFREPVEIFSATNNSFIHYSLDSDNYYFIDFVDQDLYNSLTSSLKKYDTIKVNGKKYDMYLKDDNSNFYLYRKLDDNKYIRIDCNTHSGESLEDRLIDLQNELL